VSIVAAGVDNMDGNKESDATEVSKSNYIIIKDRAYTAFKFSSQASDTYAGALNRFRESVDPKVNVYSLLAPTSVEFAEDENMKKLSESQKDAFAYVNSKLAPSINKVDAYAGLSEHKDEYVYFRTDHHWTALGAYYSYAKLMETMGETPVPLSKYKKSEIEGFLGTAYKQLLDNRLKTHPDLITYYTPFTKSTYTMYSTKGKGSVKKVVDPNYAKISSTFYAVFLGGDYPWGEISTDNKNGKRIVVVKDSYANAFVPFLLPHFEKVYYLDPRSYTGNILDFVKEKKITDVLFLNNSTVARNSGIADYLNKLMDVGK
jgi:hypothetical protein